MSDREVYFINSNLAGTEGGQFSSFPPLPCFVCIANPSSGAGSCQDLGSFGSDTEDLNVYINPDLGNEGLHALFQGIVETNEPVWQLVALAVSNCGLGGTRESSLCSASSHKHHGWD